jgi:hypothetical protein
MDACRFDRLTRALAAAASRRQTLVGLVLGAVALRGRGGEVAASPGCKKKGKRCKKNKDCCSGTCKGKKGKKKCKNTAGARGCTIEDTCGVDSCPDFPGAACGVTVGGKPFCFTAAICFACSSDAQCVAQFGDSGPRCISCPTSCDEQDNFRACARFTPG